VLEAKIGVWVGKLFPAVEETFGQFFDPGGLPLRRGADEVTAASAPEGVGAGAEDVAVGVVECPKSSKTLVTLASVSVAAAGS
jgi:hypothetical protein